MMMIMRDSRDSGAAKTAGASLRARRKAESHHAIVAAASRLFRRDGIDDTPVAAVMAAAGLTHGAFYSHFADKDALATAAFTHAAHQRDRWFAGLDDAAPWTRLNRITKRYLNRRHRDTPEDGCPFPALCPEMAALPRDRRHVVDQAIEEAVRHMAPNLPAGIGAPGTDSEQAAMALLSLFVGATLLSRTVASTDLADALLDAGRQFVLGDGPADDDPHNNSPDGKTP